MRLVSWRDSERLQKLNHLPQFHFQPSLPPLLARSPRLLSSSILILVHFCIPLSDQATSALLHTASAACFRWPSSAPHLGLAILGPAEAISRLALGTALSGYRLSSFSASRSKPATPTLHPSRPLAVQASAMHLSIYSSGVLGGQLAKYNVNPRPSTNCDGDATALVFCCVEWIDCVISHLRHCPSAAAWAPCGGRCTTHAREPRLEMPLPPGVERNDPEEAGYAAGGESPSGWWISWSKEEGQSASFWPALSSTLHLLFQSALTTHERTTSFAQ